MKSLSGLLLLVLLSLPVMAHPGVGIVQDSRGNVFLTDLKQVWKLAPDGQRSVAVPNVHTHELILDKDDNLYGEHLWYEGEAADKWGHRVWCLKRDGTLSDVIPAREGFLRDYSFVRDHAGNMYWADPGKPIVIKKRTPTGQISLHATGDFRDPNRLTALPDGTLFLVDAGRLLRILPDGKVSTIVERLSAQRPPAARAADRHYAMGVWADNHNNVYVAIYEERTVVKVQMDGTMIVVAHSAFPWSPAGGLVDRDGKLWLLENSVTNAVRVRKVGDDKSESTIPLPGSGTFFNEELLMVSLVIGGLLALLVAILFRRWRRVRCNEQKIRHQRQQHVQA